MTAGSGSELSEVDKDLLAVAMAVGVVRGRSVRPTWQKSGWSMANGNCVEVAALPAAGGVCHCGGDPNCQVCHGSGTVWI